MPIEQLNYIFTVERMPNIVFEAVMADIKADNLKTGYVQKAIYGNRSGGIGFSHTSIDEILSTQLTIPSTRHSTTLTLAHKLRTIGVDKEQCAALLFDWTYMQEPEMFKSTPAEIEGDIDEICRFVYKKTFQKTIEQTNVGLPASVSKDELAFLLTFHSKEFAMQRVLMYIIIIQRATHREYISIALSSFVKYTGLCRNAVMACIRRLVDKNVIVKTNRDDMTDTELEIEAERKRQDDDYYYHCRFGKPAGLFRIVAPELLRRTGEDSGYPISGVRYTENVLKDAYQSLFSREELRDIATRAQKEWIYSPKCNTECDVHKKDEAH